MLVVGTHIQAPTFTSRTSLKITVGCWHTYPSIHFHISNLSQDHCRLLAHISKQDHCRLLAHMSKHPLSISNLSQDQSRLLAHISKHSLSHLKPLSRSLSFVGTHIQAFTFTSQTSLCRLLAHISKHSLSHLKPLSRSLSFVGTHIQVLTFTSQTSLKITVACWHTYPSIHFHISNLSQDHCRLLAHMSKHSRSHFKLLSRSLSFVGTHIQAFTFTSKTSLKITVVCWHTYPSIHVHISNLSQDHCRMLAHISKHPLSHLKPLSRSLSFVGTHVQAFTFTSQTSLKITVVCWHTYPSIHVHISNFSQDHCRLLAHISKHSRSHLKPLSRSLSYVGTHIQAFTFTSQTSLKITVVCWHTYPSIHFIQAFTFTFQTSLKITVVC